MIEWFHQQLKAAIMCYPNSTWLEALSTVALGLLAIFKPDIQVTPTELVFGQLLRLPGELLSASTRDITSSDVKDFYRPAPSHNGYTASIASGTSHQAGPLRVQGLGNMLACLSPRRRCTCLSNRLTPDHINSSVMTMKHSPCKSAGRTFVSPSTD